MKPPPPKTRAILDILLYPIPILIIIWHCVISAFGVNITFSFVWILLTLFQKPLLLRKAQSWLLDIWMVPLLFLLESYGGLTPIITGDPFISKPTTTDSKSLISPTPIKSNKGSIASALVVCNHRQWLDSILLYIVSRQAGMQGDLKFFAKKSLVLFPIYGISGRLVNVTLFIRRTEKGAQKMFNKIFHNLTNPKSCSSPFWLISFLEGTRLTEAKLKAAKEFAKEKGLKELEHVMQPRVKGFQQAVHELRDYASSVCDITLGYKEGPGLNPLPEFRDTLFKYCWGEQRIVHVHQKRYDMSQIPTDDEEVKKWVYDLFSEKDEQLKHFHQSGKFPGQEIPLKRISLPKMFFSVVILSLMSLGGLSIIWLAFRLLKPGKPVNPL